jgi:hypothetical protein
MSRISQLIKLANATLSKIEKSKIENEFFYEKGFSGFEKVLNTYGFSFGNKFAKNKYYILRGNTQIDNAYLQGDPERMSIIIKEPPALKKKRPPKDSYYSPAHLHELELE